MAAPRTRAELLAEVVEADIAEQRLAPGDRIGTKDELRRRAHVAHARSTRRCFCSSHAA
jgi:DNA-binding FadR family transcriptional regulator